MSDLVPVKGQEQSIDRPFLGARDLVYIGFRRRWIILAVWLPIVAVGVLAIYQQAGSFVASSKVMLELSDPASPQSQIARSGDYDLALNTYSNLGMSVPVANRAAEMLADSLDFIVSLDPVYEDLRRRESLIEFILDRLSIGRVEESNLLDIQYASPYWELSLMIDRAVQTAFLEYTAKARTNKNAVAYYEEQVAGIQADIDSLLNRRGNVVLAAGLTDLDVDTRTNSGLHADLESELMKLRVDISYRESHLNQVRAAVALNPDYMPMDAKSNTINGARDRVEEEERRLGRLRATHPEGSPPVVRQEEVVANTREAMRRLVQEYVTSEEIMLQSVRSKEAMVASQLDAIRRQRAEYPAAYRQLTFIDAQLRAKTKVLEEVQMKLGDVVLNAMADERVNRLIKVTSPEIVTVVSGARRFLYLGMLTVFGLVLGLVIALIVDRGDQRIHSTVTLAGSVDAPLLGAISATKD